jgi:hypothetical protein
MASNAFQLGWQQGAEIAAERRARQQALNDQEFQARATELGTQLDNLRQQLGQFKEGSREHSNIVAEMQSRIGEIRELYHPDTHPGAIQKFSHLLTDALHVTSPQKRVEKAGAARAAASAEDERRALEMAQAGPLSPEQLAAQQTRAATAAEEATRNWQLDWAKRHNIPAAAMAELTSHLAGVPPAKATLKPLTGTRPYKGADGRYYQSMLDPETRQITAQPMPEDYTPPPPTAKTPNRDDKYIAILQKAQAGQALTPDDQAYKSAYDLYVQKTKVSPGVARAAAFAADRYIPVIDPEDPERVTFMRAGDAARTKAGSPQSIAYKTDAAMSKYMTSGKGGQNLNAFVTATSHLKLLKEAAIALANGDTQAFNRLGNAWATATGSPAPTDFNSVRNAVSGELAKTFSSATIPEIADIQSTINSSMSPAQLAGAIDTDIKLMDGKLEALRGQYEAGKQGVPNFPGATVPPPGSPMDLKNKAKANLGGAVTDDDFLMQVGKGK